MSVGYNTKIASWGCTLYTVSSAPNLPPADAVVSGETIYGEQHDTLYYTVTCSDTDYDVIKYRYDRDSSSTRRDYDPQTGIIKRTSDTNEYAVIELSGSGTPAVETLTFVIYFLNYEPPAGT